jgi:hypothetical protein
MKELRMRSLVGLTNGTMGLLDTEFVEIFTTFLFFFRREFLVLLMPLSGGKRQAVDGRFNFFGERVCLIFIDDFLIT